MIIGDIANIEDILKHSRIPEQVAVLISDVLNDEHLAEKPTGRYEIKGDHLFYMVQEYTTKPSDECKPETHQKYIDLQLILEGTELICCAPRENLKPGEQEKEDLYLHPTPNIREMSSLILNSGMLAIFYPEDAHMPCLQVNGPAKVKKLVVKIEIGYDGNELE